MVLVGVVVRVGVDVAEVVEVEVRRGVGDVSSLGVWEAGWLLYWPGVAVEEDLVAVDNRGITSEEGEVGVNVGCTYIGGGVLVGTKDGRSCSSGVMVGMGMANAAVTAASLVSISVPRDCSPSITSRMISRDIAGIQSGWESAL
jgi:hypothetical protein